MPTPRSRGALAVVPRTALVTELREGDVVEPLPFGTRVRLSLVTGRGATAAADLVRRRRELARLLSLTTRAGAADQGSAHCESDDAASVAGLGPD